MNTPLRLATALALSAALHAADAAAQGAPRYLPQVQAELQAMGVTAQCAPAGAQAGVCRSTASAAPAPGAAPTRAPRRFALVVEYSDASDTLYVYLDRWAVAPADSAGLPAVLRRAAEVNWEMLVGKLEWSSRTGELRLGAVMHTDSNFDRRAFRGVVRAVLRLGDRYAEEFSRLTGAPVGDLGPATPAAPAAPVAPAAPTPPGALTPIPAPTPR